MSTKPNFAGLTNKTIFNVEFEEPYDEKIIRGEETTNIRSIIFSPKGNYLAYRADKKTEILRCSDLHVTVTIEKNVKDMFFSPLDTYFVVWELFAVTKDKPQGSPNLHVYNSSNGELVSSFVKKNQLGWEPQWTADEKLFTLQMNNSIMVYESEQLNRYVQQFHFEKLSSYKIAPSQDATYYFGVFTLGKAEQPSFWRVYKYPQVELSQAVTSRSSFQADKASFHWNRRGTNLLVLLQTEVDKTGGSYYGRQTLSHGDVKGNTGIITFNKEGPIHAVAWNPGNWNEWVAVYGHAPAKATLFNTKCEPLFEFGTGSWNSIYMAPDGNYVLLGGFGNISTGHIEVWDLRGYKKLGSCMAPDSTYLQWDPRGETFLTATTYPRLTVGNGYKIWHYTGALMHKRPCQEKEYLLGIAWRPGTYPKSELSRSSPKSIEDSAQKPVGAYRPPGARNKPSTFKLHEHEKPHKPGQNADATPSKQALEQKKKREARKARKAAERAAGGCETSRADGDTSPATPVPSTRLPFISTGDPEKDKKIKNIHKKLGDIEKLKAQKAAGKPLELNQIEKIKNEAVLLAELEKLRL